MFHQPNLGNQPASRLASSAILRPKTSSLTSKSQGWIARSEMAADELAYRTLIAFRSHSHINNVLTHISGGNWGRVEQELRAIFDLTAAPASLSGLARNILDLMCVERGVTGRILKPFFLSFLRGLLEQEFAERTIRRVTALYLGADCTAHEAMETKLRAAKAC